MAKDVILVLRGTVDWAKVTGKARPYTGNPKYDKGPYWSVDLTPDANSRRLLKENGLDKGGTNGTGKLRSPKDNDNRQDTFLSLKILENKADGSKNDPPSIKDVRGQVWNGSLIGNGSVCDIKVRVKDYGSGSEKGFYFQAMRVLEHVPYESNDFAPLSEDDEYFAGGTEDTEADVKAKPEVEDFDDSDVPFNSGN